MNWRTFRERIPPPKKRLIVWVPRLDSWELASLAGDSFTILSGTQAGTVVNWREVSHYLMPEPPIKQGPIDHDKDFDPTF